MSNVTWQEPQVLVDLLLLNLYAQRNGMDIPGPTEVDIISPWLSDVEMSLGPSAWHQHLTVGEVDPRTTLLDCMRAFLDCGWSVRVAVLNYGPKKDPTSFAREKRLLRRLVRSGAKVYLLPKLHAKGLVTPLGLVTGSTNLTMSGLYEQSQNAQYFPHSTTDYAANRAVLLGNLEGASPTSAAELMAPGSLTPDRPIKFRPSPLPNKYAGLLSTPAERALAEAIWSIPEMTRPDFETQTDFELATEMRPALMWPTERLGVVVAPVSTSEVEVLEQAGWRVVRVSEAHVSADPVACALSIQEVIDLGSR